MNACNNQNSNRARLTNETKIIVCFFFVGQNKTKQDDTH